MSDVSGRAELLNRLNFDFLREILPLIGDNHNFVPLDGNLNASMMFIGEAPGRDEDEQGEPFVGKSGRFLTAMMRGAGISRSDVAITNRVPFRPPENNIATVDFSSLAMYDKFLDDQISIIKPRVICTLGAFATHHFFDFDKLGTICGKPLRDNRRNCWVVPTYHPSYVLRVGTIIPTVIGDLKTVAWLNRVSGMLARDSGVIERGSITPSGVLEQDSRTPSLSNNMVGRSFGGD